MDIAEKTLPQLEQLAAQPTVQLTEQIDALLELSSRIRQNDVMRSLEYDLKAKELALHINDNERLASALRFLSDDYMLIGDNAMALQMLQECLAIVEPMKDAERLAGVYLNIGAIHNRMDNDDMARRYFNTASKYFEQANNQLGIAKCLANVGLVLMDEGKYAEAENHFKQSISISQKLNVRIGEAINTSNLGNLMSRKREFAKAHELYKRTLEIYIEIDHQSGIAAALINLGNINADLGELEQALFYLNEALSLNKSLGTRYYEVTVHKNLYEVYERLDRLGEALKHYKLYHKLKEEVLSNQAKQKAAEIEMQGQLAIKEKEIEIEKLRNVELKQAYDELNAAQEKLMEKERMAVHGRLASEIAHEVQNPLQFVNNFASLNLELLDELREAIAKKNPTEANIILDDISRNSHSIEEHGKRMASIIMKLQLKR